LACGVDDFYETHPVVNDQLLSIRVFYRRIICLNEAVEGELDSQGGLSDASITQYCNSPTVHILITMDGEKVHRNLEEEFWKEKGEGVDREKRKVVCGRAES